MQPSVTKVPAVIDALVALVAAKLEVQVLDGPRVAEEIADDTVSIGLGDGENLAGYTSRQTATGGLGRRVTEDFTIRCFLSSYSGDTDIKPRRDRAAAMLGGIDAELRADPRLGGVCDAIALGEDLQWFPVQTPDGAACGVMFEVTGKALL